MCRGTIQNRFRVSAGCQNGENVFSLQWQTCLCMHFVVDVGNTAVKSALTDDGGVVEVLCGLLCSDEVRRMVLTEGITCGICSTVRNLAKEEKMFLDSLPFPVMYLSSDVAVPLRIGYSTPHTLGSDRVAAAVGAWNRFPGRNILVIDAGTAITYDVVTGDGVFLGGNISPGMNMRIKSLHEHTGKLPVIDVAGDTPLIGYSTETALRSGIVSGIQYEIQGYITRLSSEYESLLVFLTGGDAELFEKPIKNRIFAERFLVLEGLDCICKFNEKA